MKKFLLIAILFLVGWTGYAFFSAYLDRVNFQNEVDSLLQTPREMTQKNLPGLIANKAGQRNIDVDPDEIDVRIRAADRSSQLSEKLEKKGLSAETRVMDLHFQYRQTVMGFTKTYSIDRERTFTARVVPPSQGSEDVNDAFQ